MRTVTVDQHTRLTADDLAQLLVTSTDADALPLLHDYLTSRHGGDATIRLLRGHKSRTLRALFDEWAAALQFPSYFGENWAAFEDCLRDLPRANPTDHLLLIANSAELLADEPQHRATLFEILLAVPATWNTLYPAPYALKLLLHERPAQRAALSALLDELAIPYDCIVGDWLRLLK